MAPHDQGADILVTLEQIGRGKFAADATKKLHEITRAVAKNGGKGKLTITVEVAQLKGTENNVGVKAKAVAAVPQPEHGAMFFIDANGALSRDNPDMEPMFSVDDVRDGGDR